MVAVERVKSELVLNRPVYTGLCVLDNTKVLMYCFHYIYARRKYPGFYSQLLFTDTDSLVYKTRTDDLYSDMKEDERRRRAKMYSLTYAESLHNVDKNSKRTKGV